MVKINKEKITLLVEEIKKHLYGISNGANEVVGRLYPRGGGRSEELGEIRDKEEEAIEELKSIETTTLLLTEQFEKGLKTKKHKKESNKYIIKKRTKK